MKGPVETPLPLPAAEVLRRGELEKRSASLFQLWKKKRAVLSKDGLSLWASEAEAGAGKAGKGKGKELRFGSIQKLDCVERTGKYVYFTLVTTDRREIDFRCPGESCWNASIALALIDFQNRQALQDFRSRRRQEQQQQEKQQQQGSHRARDP